MRIGKSRTSITNTIRLINLDERVQEYIIEGVLTEGHGRALLAIKNKEIQYETAQMVIDNVISVRELESIIKNMEKEKTDKIQTKKSNDPYYKDIRNKLQDYFGTKVNIKNKKIEIEYYSEEDLQRILEIINI